MRWILTLKLFLVTPICYMTITYTNMSRKGPQIGLVAICFAHWGMLDFIEDFDLDGSLH